VPLRLGHEIVGPDAALLARRCASTNDDPAATEDQRPVWRRVIDKRSFHLRRAYPLRGYAGNCRNHRLQMTTAVVQRAPSVNIVVAMAR
jgi:hypothetical protein